MIQQLTVTSRDVWSYLCCVLWTEMRAVFSVFDMDRDGFITVDEVFQVLESMRFLPSQASIDDIFRQVDLDGSFAPMLSVHLCCYTLIVTVSHILDAILNCTFTIACQRGCPPGHCCGESTVSNHVQQQ